MAGDPTTELTVSVVVPSIGRGVLAQVVGNALDQRAHEVVVVADARLDLVSDTLRQAGRLDDRRVQVIAGPGRGAGPARQSGVDAATGDIVLLLDDDVVPGPGLVDGHRAVHAEGAHRVVVGYMPVAAELVARSVTAVIYANDYEAECRTLDADPSRVLAQLWGGNVSLRRSDCALVPQAVATFADEPREDEEFGFRCLRAGLIGVFDRRLAAVHWHDRSVAAFLDLAGAQVRASRLLREQYPEWVGFDDPRIGLPARGRCVLWATTLPVIGPVLRASFVALARRLGAGAPSPARVHAVVLARAIAQVAAAR